MGNPGLTDEVMQRALDTLALFDGNQAAAARSLGIDRKTYANHVEKARAKKFVAKVSHPKPRIRIPARSTYQPTPNEFGRAVRVFVFGCAHDSPSIADKSRFRHAGMLAAELRSDFIVDLGDAMDLDSLSTHAPLGSMDDRQRPFFTAEVDSLTEAYAAFHETAPPPDEIPRYHLHGNHENRAWRHESINPASQGVFTTQIDQVFARMGWTVKQYREWLFIEGVGFIHVPINAMGKEYSGLNAEQTVARETTFSVVFSHTHRSNKVRRHKVGIGNGVDVFNTGTFMPQGLIKQYAGLSQTGWTYGCHEITLRNGEIESARSWSVLELSEQYG